jgi:hypothetical protein
MVNVVIFMAHRYNHVRKTMRKNSVALGRIDYRKTQYTMTEQHSIQTGRQYQIHLECNILFIQ